MYVLYKKYEKGYSVEVEVIAFSEDKEMLMNLLPYEVERHLRHNNPKMLPHELGLLLPKGHTPIDYWARGAFDSTKFEVVKVNSFVTAVSECASELNKLHEKNNEYLKSIGVLA